MNLIEAWKKAEPGQTIILGEGNWGSRIIKTGTFTKIFDVLFEVDILSDGWEIVRKPEKKKVVINHVLWEGGGIGPVYPVGTMLIREIGDCRWLDLRDKPPMKMTLEWEE